MTAVLGTLPFLATLWLLMVLGVAVLEESGAKIAAALKGEPLRQRSFPLPARKRDRQGRNSSRRAIAKWRVAA